MSELSIFFDIVKYLMWIVLFGAIFFVGFRFLKLDYVKIAKQLIAGKKDSTNGFKDMVQHYTQKPSSQPCENGMCTGRVKAPSHGSLVRNPDTGVRLIVCAECAPAYVKTGWIPEMTWGEEFKLSAIGIGLGSAALRFGVPNNVFLGSAPTFNIFIVVIRVAVYVIAGLVVYWILWGSRQDHYEPGSLEWIRKKSEEDQE